MKLNKILIASFLSANSYVIYAGEPIEPVMVTIPAGSFQMGDANDEGAQPVHNVSVPEFSMGKYEVTVKEFRQFVEATNYQTPTECRHELDGWFKLASKGNWETNNLNTSEYQPVVCINWQAAEAYTKWLAKETGRPYRLPTEAEWEYAARAGTRTDYFFGNDEDRTQVCKYANTADLYGENILQRDANTSYHNWDTGMANCVDHSAYASIVGMYKPNQFGLHDMVSNVLEFLADCYVEGYDGAPSDGSARLDGECERRSTRGGSWHWNNWPLAQRGRIPADFAGGVDGFRVALDGSAPKQSKATKRFASSLKLAQIKEQKRRDARSDFPDVVTNLKLRQEGDMVTLTWDKSKQEGIEGYRVYRNEVSGTMVKLLASNLKEPKFQLSDTNTLIHDYHVVAVKNHQQGHYGEAAKTMAGWAKVPGRVEAEAAAEISDTQLARTSDVDGNYNLTGRGGIGSQAKMDYQLEVTKSGNYTLSYRVAAPRDTKGFALVVNGKEMNIQKVAKTGGYHEWQTQAGTSIYLKKGKNTLTLKSLDNNWKLNWLAVKQG